MISGSPLARLIQATRALWFAALTVIPTTACGGSSLRMDAPVCAACRIAFDTVATLDFSDAPTGPNGFPRIAVLPGGGFAASRLATPWQIALFDPDGRFLRVFGQKGSGPAEFKDISQHCGSF